MGQHFVANTMAADQPEISCLLQVRPVALQMTPPSKQSWRSEGVRVKLAYVIAFKRIIVEDYGSL
jgi:hypothetical protein